MPHRWGSLLNDFWAYIYLFPVPSFHAFGLEKSFNRRVGVGWLLQVLYDDLENRFDTFQFLALENSFNIFW